MRFSDAAIAARRERFAQTVELWDRCIVIAAGDPIPQPSGSDQVYAFQPNSDYYWLTGSRRPGGAIAFDPEEGWVHFVVPVSEGERVWEGVREEPVGTPIDQLEGWIRARGGREVLRLGGGSPVPTSELEWKMWHARRGKDAEEVTLMREVARATAAGYVVAKDMYQAGVSEHQVRVEMESAYMRAGADGTGYNSIVGFGDHAAVLHFAPTKRVLNSGEVMLIDSGAQIDGYVIDVTRTFVPPTGAAQELYGAITNAINVGISKCTIGTEWLDVHRAAVEQIAAGLIEMGVLNCSVEAAIESEVMALFMPHGVGHMLGLGVRDAGGSMPGRTRPRQSCGMTVRCDLPLAEGYVMTVEPGCYFIAALLNDPARREKYKSEVNWTVAECLLDLGGVRLEDDVLVTANGPVNLTEEIPR